MTVHLVLGNYTFCGKDIDSLKPQEKIIAIKKLNEDLHELEMFKSSPILCKFCLHELQQEEALIRQKNSICEDINEPVI